MFEYKISLINFFITWLKVYLHVCNTYVYEMLVDFQKFSIYFTFARAYSPNHILSFSEEFESLKFESLALINFFINLPLFLW